MSKTPIELIQDETDDGEEIHAVMLASETDDGEQYYIVLRSGEHEGNLMLKERYFVVRPDGTGTYMGNGINRRVPNTGDEPSKEFARGLARLYARLSNEFNPQATHSSKNAALLIGAGRDDNEVREIMTTPVGEQAELEDDLGDDRDRDDETPDPKESATGETPDLVECEKCGHQGPREEMLNFGGGVLDVWVHEAGCPE